MTAIDFSAKPASNGAAKAAESKRVPIVEWGADDAGGAAVQAEPKARFKIWEPEEIYEPLAEPEYAVAGLIIRGAVAMMCATGSSLKTWATIDLLVAVAMGRPWLERFACEQGKPLLIDWESGDYETRRRIQADTRAHGILGPLRPPVRFVTMPDLFFTSDDFEAAITELATVYSVIAFDSLAAGSVDVDENDARFAKGLQVLKRVAAKTKCAMVVLHHSRKGKADGSSDAREAPRGTGAIFAACDVVLQLEKHKDAGFVVTQTKARGGKAVDPFILRVDDVADEGVRVYSAEIDAGKADEDAVAATVKSASKSIQRAKHGTIALLAVEKGLTSQNQIFARVKGGKLEFNAAIAELKEAGVVTIYDGHYRLNSEVAT